MLFLPASPDEVMEKIENILEIQRRENKPSPWVYRECIEWEDQNRFEIVPIYGNFYHISAQDLQQLFDAYWSPRRVVGRLCIGAVKLLGIGLLFSIVGAAHYALSAWIGNVPAAGIIIGLLLAVVLLPPAVGEVWKWFRKRNDAKTELYQQSILQTLRMVFFSRCPRCGKYFGDLPLDDDGSVRCSCGYRIERKPPASE